MPHSFKNIQPEYYASKAFSTEASKHSPSLLEQLSLQFSELALWQEDEPVSKWTEKVISHLSYHLKVLQAACYVQSFEDSALFVFSAGYALPAQAAQMCKPFTKGENLLGEVARSQEIFISDVQELNFKQTVGTTTIKPIAFAIIPLVYNRQTFGIIEMHLSEMVSDTFLAVFNHLGHTIAANLSMLISHHKLKETVFHLQKSEEKFKRLTEVTLQGIAFLNDDEIITETNKVFCDIFKCTEKEPIGVGFKALFDDLGIHQSLSEIIASKVSWEFILLRKDGIPFFAQVEAREMYHNNQKLRVATFTDITHTKNIEAELRESTERLEEAEKVVELLKEIEKKNHDIMASINYAKRIQEAVLPKINILRKNIPDSFVLYEVKDVVSGDFYWFYKATNGKIFIAAVDCTGHGVPGAFMSLLGNRLLDEIIRQNEIQDAELVLHHLNEGISTSLKQNEGTNNDGMEIALCVYNPNTSTLEFAGAKRPLVYIEHNELQVVKGSSFSIGGTEERISGKKAIFEKTIISIHEPMVFYIFSDGFQDQFGGEKDKRFSKKRMFEMFMSHHHDLMQRQRTIYKQTLKDWLGNKPLIDDILLIGFRITPPKVV